jgi:hypothetical protein
MSRFKALKYTRNIAMCAPFSFISQAVAANDFTADKVLKEMDGVQSYTFIAGVVEGLAVARYMKDGQKPEGMTCIYDWFYDDKGTKETILAAFEKYGSYKPGAIIDVLAKQKCGE